MKYRSESRWEYFFSFLNRCGKGGGERQGLTHRNEHGHSYASAMIAHTHAHTHSDSPHQLPHRSDHGLNEQQT